MTVPKTLIKSHQNSDAKTKAAKLTWQELQKKKKVGERGKGATQTMQMTAQKPGGGVC